MNGMIPVKVKEIVMDESDHPLLLLSDLKEENVLPIGIGIWEAQAIALKLKGEITSRPHTHDLMGSLFKELDVSVNKIEIHDVCHDTFYAHIFMEKNEEDLVVDARPSDAVALALTVGASIYLSDKITGYTVSVKDLVVEEPEKGEEDEGGKPRLH